ncbi:AAA family ATPase [Komagataeibacter oboediens]
MHRNIIKKIEVKDLFGKFSYSIPYNGTMGSTSILYGDNGAGKSSIIMLVFHLLSSAHNKGHRTALRSVPFSYLSVVLSNDYKLVAERSEEFSNEIFSLQIWKKNICEVEWNLIKKSITPYEIDEELFEKISQKGMKISDIESFISFSIKAKMEKIKKQIPIKSGEKEYINLLKEIVPAIFYLNADRKLESDEVPDPSDDLDLRNIIMRREIKTVSDILQASRNISLQQALLAASKWVNTQAVRSTNIGSENVHSVYEQVISQITHGYDDNKGDNNSDIVNTIKSELKSIGSKTKEYSKYELTSNLKMDNFLTSLNKGSRDTRIISAKLISPYLRSLKSRLNAIEPIYQILDQFVQKINSFMTGKKISYLLSKGFFIEDDYGNTLGASQLSSGEQQLLLIFCYVLSARDTKSVFIIDEPEISLNVKWQRMMVSSLLKISDKSNIQFIFASHSMELISQHRDSIIPLKNTNKNMIGG